MQLRLITLVCALVVASTAGAQPVGSSEELEGLIERGADVAVTHSNGRVEGRVLDFSPPSLTLVVEGRLLELDVADITRIRQRWHDPTRDGALKGFAWVFVPFGALYVEISRTEGEPAGSALLVMMGLSSFAGYMLGEFIDARKTEMRDIYLAPDRGRPDISFGPLFSRGGGGAALSISW